MEKSQLLAWIIFLPFIGFALNAFFGRFFPKRVVNIIAVGMPAIACVFSLIVFKRLLSDEITTVEGALFSWDFISIGGKNAFTIDFGLVADPLSGVMLLVITFIGSLIHLYSTGYMAHEARYSRYFCYLNLFMGFMLLLVLSKNLIGMFIGWEGVGLCSYLLIGFFFDDKKAGVSNSEAGMKAFIVNRIGDWGFTIGMLLLFVTVGALGTWTLDIATIQNVLKDHTGELAGGVMMTLIGIFLFVGATGKSAQVPLYVWLPDAMAGPTPVSALIHAATMVTAGVYMVARMGFVFVMSPTAMMVVGIVGALTALFAATMGVAQNDIKKVLAYSTVSQLGFMFVAAGVGAFDVAIFHVMTHACFKACLFLGSGSVIMGCHHEQDMRKMGGLQKHMPITYWTYFIATLAIAGIFPFAGFFSKDEILFKAASHGGYGWVLWGLGFVAAIFTAFYMWRSVIMTFKGEYRGGGGHDDPGEHDEGHGHHGGTPHESPWTMYVPLIAQATLSVLVGFLGIPHAFGLGDGVFYKFLKPVTGYEAFQMGEHHHGSTTMEWTLMILSLGGAIFGIFVAKFLLEKRRDVLDGIVKRHADLHKLVYNKYYVDEAYFATVLKGLFHFNNACAQFDNRVVDAAVNGTASVTERSSRGVGVFDNEVVDGSVNGVADTVMAAGSKIRRAQSGNIRAYILLALVGAVVLIAVFGIILIMTNLDVFKG